ncbi:MAG: type I DNA topoisomerase [Treponema sp.]|jgi:DNA topoisomerase-1|nr:type I DNA topoisomerase [Treponema sp.]
MGKTLIIVESPAKAKTIEKYLGPDFKVRASMGHLIDLPKSRIAVDIEHDFMPEYITVRGKAKLLKELQSEAKKVERVLLASDNDREGEAIAWHLANAIAPKTKAQIQRISFNEITPQAIKTAVANPGIIDEAKINAQKARRVLDRLVGYNLSPLLWKKVKNGLSAGRVQSVALRLICEREREVQAFIPQEYWSLNADCRSGKTSFSAQLVQWKGEKPDFKKETDVQAVIDAIKDVMGKVSNICETEKTVRPKPPFTTSQLQQTAANRLGFTSKKTMQVAQMLYEGVNVDSSRVGFITYMRTDSVRIAKSALDETHTWLRKHYPEDTPPRPIEYAVGSKAQDAHEAIRPTYTEYTPEQMKDYLTRDQLRLYSIIWERFVSSQMNNAKTKTVSIDIQAGDALFRVSGTTVIQKGFLKVLKLLASSEGKNTTYPHLKAEDAVTFVGFHKEQHWTQGPSRYTDASIVKTLEEKGIGRPSTYAPIISVLLDRYYVTRSNKQLTPTVLGRLINDMLVEYFFNVVNTDFTADMESKLDTVEEDKLRWSDMLREFWFPFKERVDEVAKTLESCKGVFDEPTGESCEKCGKPLVKKLGRFGYFIACSGFPACHNTKPIPVGVCPKCGGNLVRRRARRKGREFYGCSNYPKCEYLTYTKPKE